MSQLWTTGHDQLIKVKDLYGKVDVNPLNRLLKRHGGSYYKVVNYYIQVAQDLLDYCIVLLKHDLHFAGAHSLSELPQYLGRYDLLKSILKAVNF